MATVNLDRVQYWIDQGRLNPKHPITLKELYKSGCISRPIDGLKILGDGAESLKQPIHVVASRVSASAIAATASWMKWRTVVNNRQLKFRLPDPTKRKDIEYYRDPAHRGYLSHLLKPLEGPSLFFRSSEERKSTAGVKKEKVLPENRLW